MDGQEELCGILEMAGRARNAIAEELGKKEIQWIKVRNLPPTVFTADAGTRATVKAVGVLQPICVTPDLAEIVAGQRRAAAAHAEMDPDALVPIRIVSKTGAAAVTLIENWHRRANIVTEWHAIVSLMEEGYEAEEIAKTLAVPPARIAKLLRLSAMPDVLKKALLEGHLGGPLGLAIAGLDAKRQAVLAEKYEKTSKLTHDDVRDAKEARRTEAVGELPSDMFETPVAPDAEEEVYVRISAKDAALIPEMLEWARSWLGDDARFEELVARFKSVA